MAKIGASIAIILDHHGSKVYITLRQKHQSYSNYWEFPGGKLESKESFKECLKREIYEELGITIKSAKLFFKKNYINENNTKIYLEFFVVDSFEGVPYQKENQILKLVDISKLKSFKFLPASLEVVDKLQKEYK